MLSAECLETRRVLTTTLAIPVSFDSTIVDNENDGVFDQIESSSSAVGIRNFDFSTFKIQEVAVFRFDTSTVPFGAEVNAANFNFNVASFTSSTTVFFDVYVGDPAMGIADATLPGTEFASLTGSELSTGAKTLSIPPSMLAAAVADGDLAIRVRGALNNANMQIRSQETSVSGGIPELVIDYTPSDDQIELAVPVSVDAEVTDNEHDGIFDSIDVTGNSITIRNFDFPTTKVEQLGVFEFDTSSIPSSVRIASVAFEFTVWSTTSNSTVFFDGFAGDGIPTIADATAPGTLLGSLSGDELPLGRLQVPISPTLLEDAIETGNVTIRARGEYNGANVSLNPQESSVFGGEGAELVITYLPQGEVATENFAPVEDAEITDNDHDGVFDHLDYSGNAISARNFNFPSTQVEDLGIFEFDTSSLPIDAQALQASFNFGVAVFSSNSTVFFDGYAGDRRVTFDDATRTGVELGSLSGSELELGPATFAFDPGLIPGVIEAGSLTIRMRGALNSSNIQVWSTRGFGVTPSLTVTYSVPEVVPMDFGDAPDTYSTLLENDGARHILEGPRLGPLRDEDTDGAPSAMADGDDLRETDDEDGVMFGLIRNKNSLAALNIDLQNAETALVDAWIDFDSSGTWEPNEKILDSEMVIGGLQTMNYVVPANAVAGLTHARVRVSSAGGLGPDGAAADGEVEDYQVQIHAAPQIESIEVNQGDAQRSTLTSVEVTFNQQVDEAALLNAFAVTNIDTGIEVTTLSIARSTNSDGNTSAFITFTPGASVDYRSGPTNERSSLSDGNYRLDVLSQHVQSAITGDLMQEDFVFGNQELADADNDLFFRLYGDLDGDGDVDGQDYGGFGLTFLKSVGDPEYNPNFDFDADGDVDGQDYGRFGLRFLTTRQ